jgi:hypothetical protein
MTNTFFLDLEGFLSHSSGLEVFSAQCCISVARESLNTPKLWSCHHAKETVRL